MSAPDRDGYAERQAQLLDALLRGGDYPAGFAAAQADAAGRSLRRKRSHAVKRAWPALAHELGDAFGPRFDAYARATGAPVDGDPLADGLAFARSLPAQDRSSDAARAELLLARAELRRRGVFVAAALLRRPSRRLLVVARVPRAGALQRSFRLPARR